MPGISPSVVPASPQAMLSAPRRRRTKRAPLVSMRLVWMLAVQVFPLVTLGALYPTVAARLESTTVGGVDLASLIVATAVVSPLLSSAVSGPIYAALDGIRRADRSRLVVAVTRQLPLGIIIAVVLGAVAAAVVLSMWAPAAAVAFGVLIALNLLMTAVLVPAFALGSGSSLLLAWTAYAIALGVAPELWWLPPVAAIVSQAPSYVVHLRRGAGDAPLARLTYGRVGFALIRGFSDAFPLWSLPLAVFLADPAGFSAGVVFGGFLPALLAYHVYFLTSAEPMWGRIDRMHTALANSSYRLARTQIVSMSYLAHRGNIRVVGILLGASVGAAVLVGPQLAEAPLLGATMLASGVAVILMTHTYTLSMLSAERRLPAAPPIVAGVMAFVIAACLASGASVLVLLLALSAAGLVATAVVTAATTVAWRMPEHALFWRSALGR
jgi:hypothetical protein